MDNLQLGWLLDEAAALLEISGANPFKIRAYQNGSRAVTHLPVAVSELLAEGKLQTVPGLGRGLVGEISAFFATGKMPQLEELRGQIPAGVVKFLDIPGVGPKMARQFYHELEVTNVDELEAAARAKKIRGLKGFGAKTEMSVLRGIERMRDQKGKISLPAAAPVAEEVCRLLEAVPGVEKVEVAGSFRRRCDTLKDLDVLVCTSEPQRAMEIFLSMPLVASVNSSGPAKASVLLKAGFNADFRVFDRESFACGLHYFTGSKAHNIHIRQRALALGYSLSEYRLEKTDTKTAVLVDSEAELFSHLGLAYIIPELREDRGEIQAAAAGALPQVIDPKDIRGDLHMHTTDSDGISSVAEMAAAAQARGLEYIAITDHSRSLKVANGMDTETLLRQGETIRGLARTMDLAILTGVESEILADGSLDYDDRVLAQLDVVIASIHTGVRQEEHQLTKRLIAAIENPYTHIIGHATGRMIGLREAYPVNMELVIKAAAKHKKILEINVSPERLDINETYAALCRESDVRLVINTDAHRPEHLQNMNLGVEYARRAWLEPRHVVNTWPLERLMAYLHQDR